MQLSSLDLFIAHQEDQLAPGDKRNVVKDTELIVDRKTMSYSLTSMQDDAVMQIRHKEGKFKLTSCFMLNLSTVYLFEL